MLTRTALHPIWHGDLTSAAGMLPLRRHVALLGDVVFEVWQEQPAAADWEAICEHLRMASLVEDIVATQPDLRGDTCSGLAASDQAYGEMMRLWLAGTTIFSLVWQAYELTVLIRRPGSTSQGGDAAKLLRGDTLGARTPLLDTLARAFINDLMPLLSDARRAALQRKVAETSDQGEIAALSASGLATFRNALIHGDLGAPIAGFGADDDDPVGDDPRITIFSRAIRLSLLLIQVMFAGAFDASEEVEIEGEAMTIHAWMPALHMSRSG